MDLQFKTSANFYICGQSQSGKSHLVRSVLHHLNELFDPVLMKIVYCYGENQAAFDDMAQTMDNIESVEPAE